MDTDKCMSIRRIVEVHVIGHHKCEAKHSRVRRCCLLKRVIVPHIQRNNNEQIFFSASSFLLHKSSTFLFIEVIFISPRILSYQVLNNNGK